MSREDGQIVPLIALVVVVVGAACFFIGQVGGATVERASAQTAADAAALAGAAAGKEAAEVAATANAASLVAFRTDGPFTSVEVRFGEARATARAQRSVAPAAEGTTRGLAPAMWAALARAAQLLGAPVPVTSGYRSTADQAALWARRWTNPYPVAPPGSSMHERGLAIDVPAEFVQRLASIASAAGLCHPYPTTDPVHFELCPTGAGRGAG